MQTIAEYLEKAKKNVSLNQLHHFIGGIYKTDHYPSFYRFHQTADWCVAEFNKMGLNARKVCFPADGEKLYGDWKMPKAWDAYSLRLTDTSNQKLIADYDTISTHMVMWSAPTPIGGITAECVFIEKLSKLNDFDVKNKFIITSEVTPQPYKKTAKEAGALAFLFNGKLETFQTDAVRWVNAWADRADQWAFTSEDTPFIGISLSPSTIKTYGQKLLAGEKVILHAEVNTKIYDGTLPVVEAILEGESDEEVFFTGHLFEQGANDNASGCAGMLEMARVLSKQKNKRTVRFLFTSEIYGTLPYCYENKDQLKKCKIGLNIDSIADYDRKDNKVHIYQNPDINPSFVNILLKELIRLSGYESEYQFKDFLLDDNLVADPQISITCALMAVCSYSWHTSIDTLEKLNDDLFFRNTAINLAWADIAINGNKEINLAIEKMCEDYIKGLTQTMISKEISPESKPFQTTVINEIKDGFHQFNQYYFYKTNAKISHQKPKSNALQRTYFGPPCYRFVSKDDLAILGVWSSVALRIVFLCNGNRTSDEIIAYAEILYNIKRKTTQEIIEALLRNNYLTQINT